MKNNAIGGKKRNKKSKGEQCNLEQITLKPQLPANPPLLAMGKQCPKGRRLRKAELLIAHPPNINFLLGNRSDLFKKLNLLQLKKVTNYFETNFQFPNSGNFTAYNKQDAR